MLFSSCRGWTAAAPLSALGSRAAVCSRRALQHRHFSAKPNIRPRRLAAMAQDLDPELAAWQEKDKAAPRISLAEEARTLIKNGRFGVLSTLSAKAPEGFPAGSVVEYVADPQGRPIFSFSSLSPHTSDVQQDGRCSLTVLADGFSNMDSARVNLKGVLSPISGAERDAARELYLKRHPNSFWVDFGDFTWFRMEEVAGARVVGGFGRAGKVSAEEYLAAHPDPVAEFSAPVCGHMNEDHAESTRDMVKHYVGLAVEEARMHSLDRLGVNVICKKEGVSNALKVRLPFPRPATDRNSIKELIVEMTRAAAGAPAK